MDHEALEKEIRDEGYCLVMPPRMIHVGMDFLEYLENSKLYNFPKEEGTMGFKKIILDARQVSKDISDIFGEADIQSSYLSAVADLEDNCGQEYGLAFRIVDYWWMASMLKSRHNDVEAHNLLRNECISYYSILKEEKSKNYIVEHLGKEFLNMM